LGPIKPNGAPPHATAFAFRAKERRHTSAKDGAQCIHPARQGYGPLTTLPFATRVEDYD